jgi:hypothetical protein
VGVEADASLNFFFAFAAAAALIGCYSWRGSFFVREALLVGVDDEVIVGS